ncbi:MAG: DNA primase [Pseudomonadota bacterium]
MSHIPREFIDQVLNQTNIVDVVDAVVSLKKFGANYKACCPFHDEKSPSFVVSPAKQIYHCFGCGVGGNVISFLMEHDHINFIEAITELAKRAHLTIPQAVMSITPVKPRDDLYELMQYASQFYEAQLKNTEAARAKSYLINRGLSGAIAKQFALGFAPNTWDSLIQHLRGQKFSIEDMITAGLVTQKETSKTFDKFRDRIMFPIHDRQGRIIAFGGRIIDQGEPKYLNSPETPIFHKSNELYGIYQWLKTHKNFDSVVVVEGYMDVLALVQQGVTNVVGTLGTATTEQHLQLLFRYTDKIIFCFDGDNAGKKAAWRALTIALPKLKSNKSLRFVFLPENEDPDTFIRKQGKENFDKAMQQATTLSEFFINHLSENLNLNIADNRAKFLHHANQYLQSMSDIELQRILCQELSHPVRVPAAEIFAMIKKSSTPNPIVLSKITLSSMPSTLRKAVAIVLQYPSHALSIKAPVAEISPGHGLLNQLLALIQNNPSITTSGILEYWRDSADLQELITLSAQPLLIAEKGLEQELHDVIDKMLHEEASKEIDKLIAKAQKVSLTEDEKQKLNEWLKNNQYLS